MADLIVRDRNQMSLKEFSYVIFRHKRKVVWFFLGAMVFVALATMLMPRTYNAEAKLLVKLGRESATMDPTATASGQVIQVNQTRESEIKSELEILKSRDLAEKVVDTLGVEVISPKGFLSFGSPDKLKERDGAVRKVMKSWEITADKDSNIINISYKAGSPKVAHDVVATLIDAYLEKHAAVNRTPGSYGFFKEQTDKAAAGLANVEARLAEAKNKTGLAAIDEQRQIILDRAAIFQRDLEQANADYKVSQAKITALKGQLARLPETIVTGNTTGFPNVAADGMRQKLYDLQLKEQELLSKYTEKNFLVQETRREIRNAAALLKKEAPNRAQVTKGLNSAHEQTKLALVSEEANYAALQTKSQALAANLANIKSELQAFNGNEVQIARLMREKEIQEANYRDYSKKMEQARIDTALDKQKISNISVAQGATNPLKPVSPRKGLNLALGFVFASFGAIGLGFLAENMDHSFKRSRDVEEKLHLPLLTTVPFLSENGFSTTSAKSGPPALLTDARTKCGLLGEAGESYETLCHRLLSQNGATTKSPKVIGVIGSRYGEGASTVAANLAACLASRSNERVLLVEADLQSPSAHKIFGVQGAPGLTDIVAEKNEFAACIKPSNRPNLDVIPSGQGNLTLSQLAESKEFSEMLETLRSEYSFVIFDLPPILKSNSALRLAGQTDGVVLVVGAEGISWQEGQKAIKRLAEANAQVIGVALNKRFYHIPEWLHRKLC